MRDSRSPSRTGTVTKTTWPLWRRSRVLCGRQSSDAHHRRFAQPRALDRKVSDEFTVPLCRLHHRALHARGDEQAWWAAVNIDPAPVAQQLWNRTR